jgi:hypothetical protein
MAKDLTAKTGHTKWFEMSRKIEDWMKAKKGLFVNVDFFSASVYGSMGLDPELYTPIFAVSRVAAGWHTCRSSTATTAESARSRTTSATRTGRSRRSTSGNRRAPSRLARGASAPTASARSVSPGWGLPSHDDGERAKHEPGLQSAGRAPRPRRCAPTTPPDLARVPKGEASVT